MRLCQCLACTRRYMMITGIKNRNPCRFFSPWEGTSVVGSHWIVRFRTAVALPFGCNSEIHGNFGLQSWKMSQGDLGHWIHSHIAILFFLAQSSSQTKLSTMCGSRQRFTLSNHFMYVISLHTWACSAMCCQAVVAIA